MSFIPYIVYSGKVSSNVYNIIYIYERKNILDQIKAQNMILIILVLLAIW